MPFFERRHYEINRKKKKLPKATSDIVNERRNIDYNTPNFHSKGYKFEHIQGIRSEGNNPLSEFERIRIPKRELNVFLKRITSPAVMGIRSNDLKDVKIYYNPKTKGYILGISMGEYFCTPESEVSLLLNEFRKKTQKK